MGSERRRTPSSAPGKEGSPSATGERWGPAAPLAALGAAGEVALVVLSLQDPQRCPVLDHRLEQLGDLVGGILRAGDLVTHLGGPHLQVLAPVTRGDAGRTATVRTRRELGLTLPTMLPGHLVTVRLVLPPGRCPGPSSSPRT